MILNGALWIENIGDITFEVELYYDIQPYEQRTRDYPGCDAKITWEDYQILGLEDYPEIADAVRIMVEKAMDNKKLCREIEDKILTKFREENVGDD